MTERGNSVEILQTEVNQVKNDLEALKNETDETIKQTKTETLEKNVSITKEKIKKKLEALKGFTDDISLEESKKLESMLLTLESSHEDLIVLKSSVALPEKGDQADEKEEKEEEKDEKKEEKKGRNWVQKQWNAVTSKEEWKTNTGSNIVRVVGGIGIVALAVSGLKKLFGRNKEKESEQKQEKKEKKSLWKRILLWGGGIFGGVMVWKNRDKIKNRFNGIFSKKEDKEESDTDFESDFEDLPQDKKQEYYNLSKEIDTFSGSANVNFSEKEDEDNNQKGALLHDLDNEIGDLAHFHESATLDYIQDETSDGIIDRLKNNAKGLLYKSLGKFLSRVASFQPLGAKFVSEPAETLKEWLKGGTPEEREKILSNFYKEYMNVLSYITNKRELLLDRKAKEKVMGPENIDKDPNTDQEELIEKFRKDEVWCNKQLENVKLVDMPKLMEKYKIERDEISKDTKEIRDKIQEEKEECYDIDDDGESVFTRAETDFVDGSLENSSKEDLIDSCKYIENNMFGGEQEMGFFGAYTHLITELFDGNNELAERYMKEMEFDELMIELKGDVDIYQQKLQNNTFTKEDLSNMQNQFDTYFENKTTFTEHMKDLEKNGSGTGVDIGEVLTNVFIAPFLDIGKAFGFGKTNSWRERIGRGLGGAFVGGGSLYIYGFVAKRFGAKIPGEVLQYAGKQCIKIGSLPIEMLKKGITLSMGRTYLTGMGRSDLILKPGNSNSVKSYLYTPAEQERMIKYAFLRGEISEKKALILYETIGSVPSVKSFDEMLKKWEIVDPKERAVFIKHFKNKNIRNMLMHTEKFTYQKREKNVLHTFKDRVLKKEIKIDTNALKKLTSLDAQITKIVGTSDDAGKFMEAFMGNIKALDRIEDFVKNEKLMTLAMNIGKQSDDYLKFSRIFAKNFHKFTSVQEVETYLNFLLTRKQGVTNFNTFASNTIGNRSKLKVMNATDQARYIESAQLESSFLERRIGSMKDNFRKSAETLRKLVAEKRTPYTGNVSSVANNLDEIVRMPNEDITLMAEAQRIGNGNWISIMSKNTNLIKRLSPLFNDKVFLKELSSKKTIDTVRELFASKGIKDIPEEFTLALSKTKNTKKIIDTMRYVERYEKLSKVGKILQKPGMKYAARVLGKVFVVGTVVVGGVLVYNTYKEGSELAKTNKERGELMQTESFVDIGMTVAGACAFIPGIGWVASGIIVAVTTLASVVKEYVFDTLDKYKKNYKDFVYSTPILIKQHILTTIMGSAGEDRGFGDWIVGVQPGMESTIKELTKKTGSESIKALLFTEEWKKNPLAMIDIDDTDLIKQLAQENPPITREQIALAKDEVEKNVEKRYEYLKEKCGTFSHDGKTAIDIQSIVSIDNVKQGEGIHLLDQLMIESEYALHNSERFGSKEQMVKREEETKVILGKDKEKLLMLEKTFYTDKPSLLYFYRYLNEFRQHMEQFGFDDEGKCIEPIYDAIIQNMEYFDEYMTYKIKGEGISVITESSGFAQPNFTIIRDFFSNFQTNSHVPEKELYASGNKLQNILYRIATEVVGAETTNTMEDLQQVFSETNEQTYGIYFDEGNLRINGNYFGDTKYKGNDVQTIEQIKRDIQQKVEKNDLIDIGTGDRYLNKEIGRKYLVIIAQELSRK